MLTIEFADSSSITFEAFKRLVDTTSGSLIRPTRLQNLYAADYLLKRLAIKLHQIEEDKCWLWNGPKNNMGYGFLGLAGKHFLSHRVSYCLFNKVSLLPRTVVCHRCDTPRCINPNHLFVGTQKENAQDCFHKGRTIHPWTNTKRKLTWEQVHEIRRMHKAGISQRTIAKHFNIRHCTVGCIVRGETWTKKVQGHQLVSIEW